MVCEGVGVSLPGRVDEAGRLVFAPNLGWRDVDLQRMLEAATGLPVNVENAANACALGELWFGSHDEHIRHLVAVTVSEGIGVGVLLNGQLVQGANAMAGEFGHIDVDETGRRVVAESAGAGSGTRRIRRPWTTTSSEGRGSAGQEQPALRFEDLLRLAAADDSSRHRDTRADGDASSARGSPTIVTGLAPQVIVVIGEVTGAWDRVGPIVADVLERRGRFTRRRRASSRPTTRPSRACAAR